MQNQTTYSFEKENPQAEGSIRDVFEIARDNWYWFLFSIVICVGAAFFYTKAQTQIYRTNAVIMIKTDVQKGGNVSESAIFADMGLDGSVSVVENEIPVLRSTALMEAVVERLGLDVIYTIKPLLRTVDMYGKSPVEVSFPDKELMRGFRVSITPLSEHVFNYGISDEKGHLVWNQGRIGDTISVHAGKFVVHSTPRFSANAIGEAVTVSVTDVRIQAKALLQNLTVKRTDKITGILNLTLENDSFQRSMDVLDMLIAVYNEEVINDKNRVANSTEKFIVERIASISKDLGGIDGQIEQLKRENKITDFSSTSGMLLQTGSKYKEEVVEVETEISLVQFIKDYLSDPKKRTELIPTNTGISDIGIETQITRYNEERLRLDKLSANSGANNPVTIELINNLNVTKANMIRSIDNRLSSLRIKRNQALAQEGIANRRIASVPTQEKQVNDVIRQQKIKEELYLYLLNKREENALSLAITESNAKIIERADGSKTPIAPVVVNFLILAFIIGFSIPAAVIVFLQWLASLDTKVHSRRDVENNTSIPVVGELPRKHKDKKEQEIIISEIGRDRISETFRMVRSNLDYISKKKSDLAQVIQLTSTMPGEGKTYVTINLALSYAHTGKRVLVVDLDLRKGKLSKIMGTAVGVGMSGYLSGKFDDYRQMINPGVLYPSLDLITIGAIPPNPANLLMSERFESVISQLRVHYDYIFLDSVPYFVVADASLINRVADLTLYVMRDGRIDKRELTELERVYRENKIQHLSILLTDVDVDNRRYGYGYGHGYGYGYGYVDGE